MKSTIYLTSILLLVLINLFGQENKNEKKYEIRKTLDEFQKGYAERNTAKTEEWCTSIFFDNV